MRHDTDRDERRLLIKWKREIADMMSVLARVLESRPSWESFTLDPSSGRVWLFKRQADALDAFHTHSVDGQPVYFYSVTNGTENISKRMAVGYAGLLERGMVALVGRWAHGGRGYVDASTAIDDGMDDRGMSGILDLHDQKSALKIEGIHDEKGNIARVQLIPVDGPGERGY